MESNPCVMAGIERAPKADVNFLGHMLCLACSFLSYAHIKICQVVKILKCFIEYSTEVCLFLLRSKDLSLVYSLNSLMASILFKS